MQFQKLVLENDPLFGNAELEFTPGLTVIYGLNKVTKASRNGNFAGKSYLLSQIPEITWESPVLGTKEDRVADGRRELHLRVRGADVRIVRDGKRPIVYSGDTPMFKGIKDTKDWIAKLPISEHDFNGLYYLDSRKAHPLVMGTSSERNAYMTKFFNLDKIDKERKLINAKLAGLKIIKAKYVELERTVEHLEPTSKVSKKQIEKLTRELDKYTKRQRKYTAMQRAVDFAETLRPQLRLLRDAIDFTNLEELTEENFKRVRSERLTAIEEDSKLLDDARGYAEYTKANEAYVEATTGLSDKQLRGLGNMPKLKRQYEQYRSLDSMITEPGAKPQKPDEVAKPKHDGAELRLVVLELKRELEHIEKFHKGKCPTCGSKVKARKAEVVESELAKATKRYKQAQAAADDYEEYKEELYQYKASLAAWKTAKKQSDEQQARLAELKKPAELYRSLKDVPEKPKPFKGKRLQLKVVERMVDLSKSQLEALKQVAPGLPLLQSLVSAKKQRDYSQEIANLTTQLTELKAKRLSYKAYLRQKSNIDGRLDDLREQLSDEPALKLLMEAYSEKGMKRLAIEAVSKMLAAQLNKYSSFVFPDNYRFSVEWTRSKLSILCHRPRGKIKVTDVRKLSGAENRLFTYLLVFAQLQFVPQQRRSSLMVMDEPTTNMHPETAESFKQVLKLLLSVIPSVVVITPQSTESYEDARLLTVVRRNGLSKIVPGHPNSME